MATFAQIVLWCLPPFIQAGLLVIMWRRNLRREFPIFFTYLIAELVSFAITFTTKHISYAAYFYAYYVSAIIAVGFGFAVMYEIFHHIFRPYDALRDLANVLFKWSALVLVLVAVVNVLATGSDSQQLLHTVLVLGRSIRVMQCGLVLFLFLFSSYVGLSSRSHVFGIALGFGIFAAVNTIVVTLRVAFASVSNTALNCLTSGAYCIACMLWFYNLRVPEPERQVLDHRARGMEWNLALGSVGPQQESFLPMIESAVERVLQKRQAEAREHS